METMYYLGLKLSEALLIIEPLRLQKARTCGSGSCGWGSKSEKAKSR